MSNPDLEKKSPLGTVALSILGSKYQNTSLAEFWTNRLYIFQEFFEPKNPAGMRRFESNERALMSALRSNDKSIEGTSSHEIELVTWSYPNQLDQEWR